MSEKADLLKAVTVLLDTREKQIEHITGVLDALGVQYKRCKLDIGDISFCTPVRDFALSCSIERKADIDELYGNVMEKGKTTHLTRIEKELDAASRVINQFTLLIEGVDSMEALRDYVVPDWAMKMSPARVRADIGRPCYERLRAWQAGNRYNFRIECVGDREQTAWKVLELFYYYHHNYKALIAPRR